MIIDRNNGGRQTELVKNAIIRHIRDSRLAVGDKLPTQAELRDKLGVGSETIRRAVSLLRESGILEQRGNKGVFLRSIDADGSVGRHVGLICMRIPSYLYGVNLLQCLELQLYDRGCQTVLFLRDEAPMGEHDSLDLFSGLRRNIRQRSIDGLVTTVPLDEEAMAFCRDHEIPVCYYGNHTEYPFRVYQGQGVMDEGLEALVRHGCRRPAMIHAGYPDVPRTRALFRRHAEPLLGAAWEKMLFFVSQQPNIYDLPRENLARQDALLERLLALPEDEWPDGFFIPDDFLTVYIACGLLRHGRALPPIVTSRCPQIPLGMPFPLLGYFEGDIMELARLTVDLLLEQVRNPGLAPKNIAYKPPYVDLSRGAATPPPARSAVCLSGC